MSAGKGLPVDGSVVVVGAGLGGLRCAEALRNEGFAGSITLVGDEAHLPYDRPPLTKQVLTGAWEVDRIALTTTEKLDANGITLLANGRAVALDVGDRTVALETGSHLQADAIVLATGTSPRWLPGTRALPRVHVVRTMEQGVALRAAFDELGGSGRVVIIGGGFIGGEVASAAVSLGLDVTILEALATPLSPIVGEEMGSLLSGLHSAAGVDVRTGVTVSGIDGDDGGLAGAVVLDDMTRIDADVIVVGIGVVPNTQWLEQSGLELGNGVVTDAALFAADGVVAIGDIARFEWRHGGVVEQVRIEHWQVAADHAAAAARSLLAGRAEAPAVSLVPYFWSDQHGKKIQMLGHPGPADSATCVLRDDEAGRFVTVYGRDGMFTGVLGLSSPRQVMGYRSLLLGGATYDEALDVGR
jgi:3-phenylpropionate/trans-cinnamate dioxygenase ferredoxin reductase subunit